MTVSTNPKKQALFTEFARITKALAHPTRLELLDFLCQAPRTVEVLAHMTGQSVATASHHLRILLSARLVSTEKKGLFVTYRLADGNVCDFWLVLQSLAHGQLADLRQAAKEFLEGAEIYAPVDRETLLEQMRRGDVTLIDVRPEEEYEAGHFPGALSVPLERLEELLPSLPTDQEIVAYCRGPFCVLSGQAVKILHRHNRQAVRMSDGIHQWQAAGLPIEVGAPAV